MAETSPPRATVPAPAKWLGAAGLVPFAGLAAYALLGPGADAALARGGLAGYGAVILSFMGGCRWGFAAAGLGEGASWTNLGLSVLPALLAWPLLYVADPARLLLLAFGFAVLLLADILLVRRGGAPDWWPRLRWPLTAGAVAGLLLGAASV